MNLASVVVAFPLLKIVEAAVCPHGEVLATKLG